MALTAQNPLGSPSLGDTLRLTSQSAFDTTAPNPQAPIAGSTGPGYTPSVDPSAGYGTRPDYRTPGNTRPDYRAPPPPLVIDSPSPFTPGYDPSVAYPEYQRQHTDPRPGVREYNPAQDVGSMLIDAFKSGNVTEGQQASINIFHDQQTEKWRQYLANAGISDSSSKVQGERQIAQQEAVLKQGFLDQTLSEGMKALELADKFSTERLNAEMAKDQQMQQVWGQVFGAVGALFGGIYGGAPGAAAGYQFGAAIGGAAGGQSG